MSYGSFKNDVTYKLFIYKSYIHEDNGCGLFTYRIYKEFHINLWECLMYGYYIFPIQVYIIKLTYIAYSMQLEENTNLVNLSL